MARAKSRKAEVVEELTEEKALDILEEEVAKEKPAPKKEPKTRTGVIRNCGLLNVREKASLDARAVTQLIANTKVTILGEENNFYKVENGYVMKDFVEII